MIMIRVIAADPIHLCKIKINKIILNLKLYEND